MLRIEAKTRLTREEVMKYAMKYFNRHRMKVVDQSTNCVSFEGSGGGINVSTSVEDGLTIVEVVSREWDKQANDFLSLLPKRVKEKRI